MVMRVMRLLKKTSIPEFESAASVDEFQASEDYNLIESLSRVCWHRCKLIYIVILLTGRFGLKFTLKWRKKERLGE